MAAETCNDSIRLRKPGNEGYWSLKGFFFIGFFCSRIGCLTRVELNRFLCIKIGIGER